MTGIAMTALMACDLCGTVALFPDGYDVAEYEIDAPVTQCAVVHFGACMDEPEACDGSQCFIGWVNVFPSLDVAGREAMRATAGGALPPLAS